MVPNTLLTPHQSINLLNNNLMNPDQHSAMATPPSNVATPKRKRGRPPKPNNFSNKITRTINISINTSPLSNSPDAENNSNQIVKRGIPDIFTPTMRVSPNANIKMRRRSKKNSISSIDGINSPNKQRKNSYQSIHSAHSTQSSPANDYINSKTLDNISMITNPHPSQNANLLQGAVHGQPPQPVQGVQPVQVGPIPNQLQYQGQVPYSSPPPSAKQPLERNDRNLLPPVLIRTEKSISPTNSTDSLDEFNDFNLRLMIDDSGKAVLSNQKDIAAEDQSPHTVIEPNDSVTVETNESEVQKPRLYHSNSVIGIESNYMNELGYGSAPNLYSNQSQSQPQGHIQTQHQPLQGQRPLPVKFHSDFAFSETNPPQTPKPKDNYLLSTGLTPLNSSLNYPGNNLTPQFNSLMNSIITSPKKFNNNQFLYNQEMFMGNGFNYNNEFINGQINSQGLMATPIQPQNQSQNQNQNQSQNQQNQQNHPQQPQNQMQSFQYGYQSGQVPQQAPQQPPQQVQMNQSFQFNDDSDARLALKKMIHVKRR